MLITIRAKSGHFADILLCLMPDDFTCQGSSSSGSERVNNSNNIKYDVHGIGKYSQMSSSVTQSNGL